MYLFQPNDISNQMLLVPSRSSNDLAAFESVASSSKRLFFVFACLVFRLIPFNNGWLIKGLFKICLLFSYYCHYYHRVCPKDLERKFHILWMTNCHWQSTLLLCIHIACIWCPFSWFVDGSIFAQQNFSLTMSYVWIKPPEQSPKQWREWKVPIFPVKLK